MVHSRIFFSDHHRGRCLFILPFRFYWLRPGSGQSTWGSFYQWPTTPESYKTQNCRNGRNGHKTVRHFKAASRITWLCFENFVPVSNLSLLNSFVDYITMLTFCPERLFFILFVPWLKLVVDAFPEKVKKRVEFSLSNRVIFCIFGFEFGSEPILSVQIHFWHLFPGMLNSSAQTVVFFHWPQRVRSLLLRVKSPEVDVVNSHIGLNTTVRPGSSLKSAVLCVNR